MLDQCWANVADGGPTLVQHWIESHVGWVIPGCHVEHCIFLDAFTQY